MPISAKKMMIYGGGDEIDRQKNPQQPIHASLPHPTIFVARSTPPPLHHNTQNLATHSPSNHPHTTTHHQTHTRKIIT